MKNDTDVKFPEVSRPTRKVSQANRKSAPYSGDWEAAGFNEKPRTIGDADAIVAARKFMESLHCYLQVTEMIRKEGRRPNEIADFIHFKGESDGKSRGTIVKYVQLYRRFCTQITPADVVESVREMTSTGESKAVYPPALTTAAWNPILDVLTTASTRMLEVSVMEEALAIQQQRLRRAFEIETQQFRGMLWPAVDKSQEVLTKMVHELREMKMDVGMYRRVPTGVDLTVRRGVDEKFKDLTDSDRQLLNEFGSVLMQAISVTPEAPTQ